MVDPPQLAGAAQTGLHLICQEQGPVMPGGFPDARPEIVRRNDRAGLALDGFHQYACHADPDLLADIQLAFNRLRIAKRNVVDRPAVQRFPTGSR